MSQRTKTPDIWESSVSYDCEIPARLLSLDILTTLEDMKPYGHCFEEPRFRLSGMVTRVDHMFDKTTGNKKHSSVTIDSAGTKHRILLFNEVIDSACAGRPHSFIVSLSKNIFRGQTSLSITAHDWRAEPL
jgi:single-stranded DNA-specific DHH superfamily exonuclease